MDRQCSSCGGFCKKSGCERENVKPELKIINMENFVGSGKPLVPVGWMYSITGTLFDTCPPDADDGEFLPLYTAPPQREWVGLTDAEAMEIEDKSPDIRWAIIQAEAKLKEKNT
jgi:hypothetical protein